MAAAEVRHTVQWCNRSMEWRVVAAERAGSPRNAVWSYELDGLTYYSFPFDPDESGPTTTERALNWLNRHHLIVRREHLVADLAIPVR